MNKFSSDLINKANARFSIEESGMSMSNWIEKNTTLKKRPFSFFEHEFQRQIVDDMHPDLSVIKISQVGLALDLSTEIPTKDGWVTMNDIKVGDRVYDEQGKLCNVTYISPIYNDHKCYEIEFCTGDKIIADENHKWYVECWKMFNKDLGVYNKAGRIPTNGPIYSKNGIATTKLIFDNFKFVNRNIFAISNTKVLVGKDKNITLDPYYLGLWLGDGHSYSTRLTGHENDINETIEILNDKGFVCKSVGNKAPTIELKVNLKNEIKNHGLYSKLSELNLLKNKHIPKQYLRASVETRLELLQGLLDTDGSITKKGRCSFYNTNPQLIKDVEELIASLGYKSRTRWRDVEGKVATLSNGYEIKSKKPIAEISFVAYKDLPVFKLSRKKERLLDISKGRPSESFRRRIINVVEVESRPVRCISVDSNSHLFLASRAMIPTHNTEVQIRKALGFLKRNRGTSLIFSLPNEDMFERISKGRIKPIVNEDKVFTTAEDLANKVVRSTEMMQFGSSFLYVVPAIEQAATSISADFVMNDEIDLSDQKMISLFQSRLQHSKFKISQKFSTPSFPLYGIDSNWQLSDQHRYMCKCDKCNHWNHPEFNRNYVHIPGLPDHITNLCDITKEFQDEIDFSQAYVMCEKCQFPLDLRDPEKREWSPLYPSRKDNRGYQITPFVTDNLSLPYIFKQLWEYQKNDYIRGFYNTVLGLPYSDGNIQIPLQDIHACMTQDISPPDLSKFENLWVGIDVGTICHVVIGSGYDPENIDIISTYQIHSSKIIEHCKELCEKYKVRGGCIDRHPYTPTANDVFAATNGIIIPVEYRGTKEINIVKDEYDVVTHAQVNRTAFLDTVATRIRKHRIRISGYGHYKQVLIEHLRDMVRSETPEKQAEWVKLHGNDHYFHASAFMLLSPSLANLIRLKSDQDIRTSIFSISARVKDNTSNLIGVSKKRLDKIITSS